VIVYVVTAGESNLGGAVESVHKTRAGAIRAALNQKCYFLGGWIPALGKKDVWYNECDYVAVRKWRVRQ
jgi:hypothetical protein